MFYHDIAESRLKQLRDTASYRNFVTLNHRAGQFPVADTEFNGTVHKDVKVWCSNDYLAMPQYPAVISAMQDTAARYGPDPRVVDTQPPAVSWGRKVVFPHAKEHLHGAVQA